MTMMMMMKMIRIKEEDGKMFSDTIYSMETSSFSMEKRKSTVQQFLYRIKKVKLIDIIIIISHHQVSTINEPDKPFQY